MATCHFLEWLLNKTWLIFAERPESSLTVASECSSTISSEEEAANGLEVVKVEAGAKIEDEIKPPVSPTNSVISEDEWNDQSTPTNSLKTASTAEAAKVDTPTKSSRFANFLKIPKFKLKKEPEASVKQPPPQPQQPPRPTILKRSNSATSDSGHFIRGSNERNSYRSTSSRYMQAAEAYKAKKLASRPASAASDKSGPGTWSGPKNSPWNNSLTRGRSGRPQLTSDTFRPPSRPASRTTSASPGPWRRDLEVKSVSVQSTPKKKAPDMAASGAKSHKTLTDLDLDEEDAILKRMEEILLTYKSRVEDHLAAEGRELPKEIFEDFTSQWVQAQPSRPMSRSLTSEVSNTGSLPRPSPSPRKAKRDTSNTRIPMPTFYNDR